VQTFEGHDGKGNHQIGLVAVVSPKMKTFAQSVLRLRGNFPADNAKAQDLGALVKDKQALLQDFGIRWIYDQNGLPVLVSFYQWGLDASGNDPVLGAQMRDIAVKKAIELADAQIAQFLAASATLTTKSETGERYEKAVERAIDGYVSQLAELYECASEEWFEWLKDYEHLVKSSELRRPEIWFRYEGEPSSEGLIRKYASAVG
jgi:hypothetical protein